MKLKKRTIVLACIALFSILYFLGPKPSTPVYNPEIPHITFTGAALEKYITQLEAEENLKPNNQAEILWNNDSLKNKTEFVLLYLHGFSASKMEGEPLHKNFAERYGCNAYLARLSDHGIETKNPMLELTPDRLWESTKLAYAIAQQLGEKVIIMSTSTGGTMALKLASVYPEIYGLINMSPNIKINDPTAFILNDPWGEWIAKKTLGGDFRHLTGKDAFYEKYWYVSYRVESIVALEQLVETSMIKSTFQKVETPTLNLYYYKDKEHQDPVVKVEGIIEMHQQLKTPENLKRLVAIPEAGTHIIGSKNYCKDFDKVQLEAFKFTEEILKLKPVKIEH